MRDAELLRLVDELSAADALCWSSIDRVAEIERTGPLAMLREAEADCDRHRQDLDALISKFMNTPSASAGDLLTKLRVGKEFDFEDGEILSVITADLESMAGLPTP